MAIYEKQDEWLASELPGRKRRKKGEIKKIPNIVFFHSRHLEAEENLKTTYVNPQPHGGILSAKASAETSPCLNPFRDRELSPSYGYELRAAT